MNGIEPCFCFSAARKDYEPLNITITFEEDELTAQVNVKVIDNQVLQEMRTFYAVIEVMQTELFFPAQVQNGVATIEIKDDDSEYIFNHKNVLKL